MINMHPNCPLVTVVIITYNSATTVIETLDSIGNQTYSNIELIISDDCSKDNTIDLVNNWVVQNKNRFVRIEVVKSSINTGVAPNLNRGIDKAKGEWIKSLAGDDTLVTTAIEEYVRFVQENNCCICFAKMRTFGIDEKANQLNMSFLEDIYKDLKLPTREQQYSVALKRHIMPGPGIFYKRSFFYEIGRFNEKYPMAEEYDFQLRVLDRTKFYFIDKYLVNWRISPSSLSHSIDNPFVKDLTNTFQEIRLPRMLKERMYLQAWDSVISNFINSKRNTSWYLYLKLFYLLSPYWIYNKILFLLKK